MYIAILATAIGLITVGGLAIINTVPTTTVRMTQENAAKTEGRNSAPSTTDTSTLAQSNADFF
jgi:hypothetical protein